jgi:predicted nucleotidyltransferase
MIRTDRWQPEAIEQLIALLEPDPDVAGLALGGSTARDPDAQDPWSDVDALVVVCDQAFERFFPGLDWIRPLGRILGYEQHAKPGYGTLRVCFRDLRRFDLIIVPEVLLTRLDDPRITLAWQRRVTVFFRA